MSTDCERVQRRVAVRRAQTRLRSRTRSTFNGDASTHHIIIHRSQTPKQKQIDDARDTVSYNTTRRTLRTSARSKLDDAAPKRCAAHAKSRRRAADDGARASVVVSTPRGERRPAAASRAMPRKRTREVEAEEAADARHWDGAARRTRPNADVACPRCLLRNSQRARGGKTLWVDCDPGHDDAFALYLAAWGAATAPAQKTVTEDDPTPLVLAGVSTVAGNQTIEKTTANARRVLDWIDWGGARDRYGSAAWECHSRARNTAEVRRRRATFIERGEDLRRDSRREWDGCGGWNVGVAGARGS